MTQSNTGASSICGNSPPRSIAWGCEPMYGVFVARHAHPCCASEEGTRREAGAQSVRASSYVCMGGSRVAERSGGATKLRPYGEGEEADGSRGPQGGTLALGQASGLAQGNKGGGRCGGATKGLRRGFLSCLVIVLDGPSTRAFVGSL